MVTTHARRPRRAASSAKAADTVVLPTPPDPQHTTMARSATSSDSPTSTAVGPRGRWSRGAVAVVASPGAVAVCRSGASACGRCSAAAWGSAVAECGPAGASGSLRTAVGQRRGQRVELGGADPGAEEEGGLELGQGQFGGRGGPAVPLGGGTGGPGIRAAARRAPAWSSVRVTPTSAAASAGRARAGGRRAGRR